MVLLKPESCISELFFLLKALTALPHGLNVKQLVDKSYPGLLSNRWWFWLDHSTALWQWCISTWVHGLYVYVHQQTILHAFFLYSTASHTKVCAPLLSPEVWTTMKLSESYSCPALNEAHLQAQTVRSLSLSAVQTYTDTPPRGPSLMRNSSGEISSIPFGTNMHPKVWAFCISLFSTTNQTQ